MAKSPAPSLNKGDMCTVTVEALATGGSGIARYNGMTVFLDQGIPGQTATARIQKKKKRFAQATVVSVLTTAPEERTPVCIHFTECGGCLWQHMPYTEQLAWKRQFVIDALTRIGGVQHPDVPFPLPSPATTRYRNKMEFVFAPATPAPSVSGMEEALPSPPATALGLRKKRSHEVVTITECHLQSTRCNNILNLARRLVHTYELPAYNEKTAQGYLRFLIIREPEEQPPAAGTPGTRQCLVQFIVAPDRTKKQQLTDRLQALCKEMQKEIPSITALVISERSARTQIAYGEKTLFTAGTPQLNETIAGVPLMLHHDAFLQVNTRAATSLYEAAIAMAGLSGSEYVWDGYCGVGSLTLLLAQKAAHVVGFELGEAAVRTARQNAEALGVYNTEFYAGDIKKRLTGRQETPDVVVVDPPRAGMHVQVTAALLAAAPERIVYISCDPATQARDIRSMLAAYDIRAVQPVDMFPHSPHIENIVLMAKKPA